MITLTQHSMNTLKNLRIVFLDKHDTVNLSYMFVSNKSNTIKHINIHNNIHINIIIYQPYYLILLRCKSHLYFSILHYLNLINAPGFISFNILSLLISPFCSNNNKQ